MTQIAVSTGVYYRAHETQINNHISNIFGGTSVVLGYKPGETPPTARPHLIWGREKGVKGAVNLGVQTIFGLAHYRQNRTFKIPYGRPRKRIIAFLRKHSVDVILSEFGSDAARIATVAEEAGVPLFAQFRGADATSYLAKSSHVECYKRMVPKLRGVFSVSQTLLDNLSMHGISHPQSFVIPSGVDTGHFVPKTKQHGSCLAVGRFVEKKRPDITIRAFAKAARNVPHARLELIGDGPLLDQCKAVARKSGVAERVIFHGTQTHDFVRERMGVCKIFLQHSVTDRLGGTEGLPTSIQEAMSCGMVVVSTRHAGIPEAVRENETGFLADEGDEDTYFGHLVDLLSDRHDMNALAKRARSVAIEKFDRSSLLEKTENAIESLI